MSAAENRPTVVLVHGVGDNAAGWADFVEELSPDYEVVAYDQRGHGKAPRFQDLADPFAQLIDDLLALLEHVGPAFVVGHSMGGAVAAEAAVRRPELVRALVLEDPAWIERDPEELELIGQARVLSKEMNLADMPKAKAQKRAQGWSERETQAWADAHNQTQREFLETGVVSQSRPWQDVERDVIATGIPTLVCVATGPDAVVDKHALSLPYEEFSTGHCIRREAPQEFARVVREFLELKG